MDDCLFCKIASGKIPSEKVYEDELILCFRDINPAAPTHFLVIPKEHIASAADVTPAHASLMGHIWTKIPQIASGLNDGYRVVCNCGREGGQTVGHLHFHILAGRDLAWPPG